jgi:hypothetical protein
MISFKEAAELFSISPYQLLADLNATGPSAPKAVYRNVSSLTPNNTWFNAKEMKTWRVLFLSTRQNKEAKRGAPS